MRDRYTFLVHDHEVGARLDRVIADRSAYSRSHAARLLKNGEVRIDHTVIQHPSHRVAAGDRITIPAFAPQEVSAPLIGEAIPLEVVFEDEDIIVINKAAGMVVHPAPGHEHGTLAHALLHHDPQIRSVGASDRPGIVHRLDRDTSGVMVVARSSRAYVALQDAFRTRTVDKSYLALTAHTNGPGLEDRARIETRHGRDPRDRRRFTGKQGDRTAITDYEVLERFTQGAALVRCAIHTGRTHQIRMHLRELGAPILGDPLYGGRAVQRTPLIGRTALHAHTLCFNLPWKTYPPFNEPPPDDFEHALDALRRGAKWRI